MKVEYPVLNTFIQYPACRTPSIEQFSKQRDCLSCPASRMMSLEEAPDEATSSEPTTASAEVEYAVKNTFIDWPATRDSSLEEFITERGFKSCPASRMLSLEEAPEGAFGISTSLSTNLESAVKNAFTQWPATRGPSLDEEYSAAVTMSADIDAPLKSVTQWPATRGPSLEDECPLGWNLSLQELLKEPEFHCDASTAASTNEETAPASQSVSDDEAEAQAPLVISLTSGLGISSAGSIGHEFGMCKPCAFLWKESGCEKGQDCPFCHLCPAGEVKRRKKEKLAFRKAAREFGAMPSNFYGVY